MNLSELKLTDRRATICKSLDLNTVEDVFSYYPFRYENYKRSHFKDFVQGEKVVFEGQMVSYPSTFRYGKRSITRFNVIYEEEVLTVSLFNRPWIKIGEGNNIVIIGKYEGNKKVNCTNYYTKPIEEIEGIVPFYPLKEGISQNDIRKIIENVYKKTSSSIEETLPMSLLEAHGLISYIEAIRNIHFPQNAMDLKKALARLKYEEFLRFYTALLLIKGNGQQQIKTPKMIDRKKIDSFVSSLGYELTADQKNALNDILKDMGSSSMMYRLVQGDVGCGKTAVAMIAAYACVSSGFRCVLMAPTEILARQHFLTFQEAFEGMDISLSLLYSSDPKIKENKKKIREGKYDIIIGTHALFSDDVEIPDLGLIITDEQQRFGVKQRHKLAEKGKQADFLSMSATPIPRTLAGTIYGDMDISTIETMPPGRKGCLTKLVQGNTLVPVLKQITDRLQEGRQMYVIAPAIQHSENFNAKDITRLYQELTKVLDPYRVALLHERMNSQEKEKVMDDFAENRIQVLVSTTVVEVGVNVKNATIMVIYDAERFGLSQLHQLRGRVQRGSYQGECYLLTSSKEKESLDRLNALVRSNDGFAIALEDLKLRGPGDILGVRQSGLPVFVLGNIFEDDKIIKAARKDAQQIIEDPSHYKAFLDKISEQALDKYVD